MEKEDTTFYLGKKEKPETSPEPEQTKYRLSYGGALPASFEQYQPKQRTNEDLALARLLSEKHERKSMVVHRILYLEKRRQDLLGYIADAEKNASKGHSKNTLFILMGTLAALFLLLLTLPLPYALISAVVICGTIAVYLLRKNPLSANYQTPRQIQWDQQMQEMQEEHDALMQEKDELTAQIKELERKQTARA